ncbi:MAG: DUF839 domain-containing protein [Sulfurimonadaceae bacterium]|nr:DUF839 domain-containing protein [Sulfurimonadaceae bacterium]
MKLKSMLSVAAIAALAVGFAGCGSDSNTVSNTATTVTGTFVDGPVEGLTYECSSGTTDVTNSLGQYTCNIGDNVTFKVGAVTLGTVQASSGQVTPYTLFPSNTAAAINVAQLLQTLDDDGDLDNFSLSASKIAEVTTALDFTSATFDDDAQAMFTTLTLKNETLAKAHLNAYAAAPALDFGAKKEQELYANSATYLGFSGAKMAGFTDHVARADVQTPADAIDLADGLTATFLTREAANKADLFNFYPAENPTHLIACIEGGVEDLGGGKLNPSVQSWDLETGAVTTILRGMSRCDGIRTTAWGTVLATEETTTGQAYEIIDPLNVSEHTVTDRAAGTIVQADGTTPATKVVKHDSLPTMAWEGLTVLDNGVVIGGDELRPGTGTADVDGGAIFKFVPATPHAGGMITDLANSPLADGSVYAMQVQCKDGTSQWGQGCEVGNARWVEVNATTARADANTNGATGYYRPEDLHKDPTYTGTGVRFCWTNTGNEGAEHYGEIICGVDEDPLNLVNDGTTTIVNRFVEGDPEFTSVDSLEIHPVTGDIYGIEDHSNGDIWACLKDGADRDIKTDGCVRLLSVKDQSAEPTGFIFNADGTKAYLSIQHSDDTGMPLVDDYNTDDIIVIEGFTVPNK